MKTEWQKMRSANEQMCQSVIQWKIIYYPRKFNEYDNIFSLVKLLKKTGEEI